jgi:3-hydroxybutyryl-CoA dehydrogenase
MSESGLGSIGVIGIGTMGNGIAQVTAQSGFSTVVADVNEELLKRGLENISRSLDRLVSAYEKSGGEKGITAEAKAQAVARLSSTTTPTACWLRSDHRGGPRRRAQEEINRSSPASADKILVSNTSGISITRLSAATRDRSCATSRAVPINRGQIIRGLATSGATYATVVALCHDLGKIDSGGDKASFAINRMFVPFVNEAIRIVEEGIASVDDVDKCVYCLGHKMGPLMTADFVGLDTLLFICKVLEDEFGSFYKPSPLLRRLVESGQLGAKTGRGFYTWEKFKASGVNPDVARYRIK